MTHISSYTARKLALSQQGLLSAKPKFGRGKKAVLKAIEHLGYVQIDAISVIQRAHHHTLWSRVPGYQPKFLHQLLTKDQKIFEYWSHAASFLPMKDYPYYVPVMHSIRKKEKHWYRVEDTLKDQVLKRIETEGPLYARNFETPASNSNEMWGWKPAKQALHELFMEGKVAVISRDRFQRKYDLAERVIPYYQPASVKTSAGNQEQQIKSYIRHRCLQAIRAQGIVSIPEIRYQRPISASQIHEVLDHQVSKGKLLKVTVEKSDYEYWSMPELFEEIPTKVYKQINLLSPFDNAIIQRKRIRELFNFDYQTEIYYPVNKRRYGYFSLPILYGTDFIGRMDPKAFRDKRVLQINNVALEPNVKMDEKLIYCLRKKLQEFADFNQCDRYVIIKSTPSALKSALS